MNGKESKNITLSVNLGNSVQIIESGLIENSEPKESPDIHSPPFNLMEFETAFRSLGDLNEVDIILFVCLQAQIFSIFLNIICEI